MNYFLLSYTIYEKKDLIFSQLIRLNILFI